MTAGVLLFPVHFGEFIKRLRTDRGLTQVQLAERAGLTVTTLYRAERKADAFWYKSTALDVFAALERISPLSPQDVTTYFACFDMNAKAEAILRARSNTTPAAVDPDLETTAVYMQRLHDQAGATRLHAALEALAAAWDIDLPPRTRAPIAALKQRIQGNGVEATIYTPVNPPSTKPTPRTKSA